MYYEEMTKGAALVFIREIAENAKADFQAIELIQWFLNNEATTTEIEKMLY